MRTTRRHAGLRAPLCRGLGPARGWRLRTARDVVAEAEVVCPCGCPARAKEWTHDTRRGRQWGELVRGTPASAGTTPRAEPRFAPRPQPEAGEASSAVSCHVVRDKVSPSASQLYYVSKKLMERKRLRLLYSTLQRQEHKAGSSWRKRLG